VAADFSAAHIEAPLRVLNDAPTAKWEPGPVEYTTEAECEENKAGLVRSMAESAGEASPFTKQKQASRCITSSLFQTELLRAGQPRTK